MTSGDRPSGYAGRSSGGSSFCGCAVSAASRSVAAGAGGGTAAAELAGVDAAALDANGSARSVCIIMKAPITTAASVMPPIISGALLRPPGAGVGGGGDFLDGLDISCLFYSAGDADRAFLGGQA